MSLSRVKRMSGDVRMSAPLWTRGMVAVLAAQFLSALADNALLFGALALLKIRHYPDWTQPLLQEFFVGAYILLAPFVGPFADSRSKGGVMFIANGLKVLGGLGMCLGLNPFVAYGLVGVGAAAYSPAKYGILSELTSPERLVQANGLMESSTIAAILIGAIAGGVLADWNVSGALVIVTVCYCGAAAANLLIPKLPPARAVASMSIPSLFREFTQATHDLVKIPDARFSLVGTSVFWGAGATLRFLLVAWVPIALGVTTNAMPAYLNAMVAIGIVIGAGLAGKFITLQKADRSLPAGVLIGVAVCLLAGTTNIPVAFGVVTIVGACGGFFLIPLNALLQERGHQSVGAGNAIAVQNLCENSVMLLMIGFYISIVRAGASISVVAASFGAAVSLAIACLWIYRRRSTRAQESPAR
jgi:LPLT family lysophospholipid transporter-like MFS transporter